MKRIMLVALVILCAHTAHADEPKEILPTGNVAADTAIAIVNAMNKQMKLIEDTSDLHVKSADYYRQLMEMEQKLQQERRKIMDLDKQLATQEGDLLSNFKSQKAGKGDAEVDALEAEYNRRKKELAQARKQVNGLPGMFKTVGGHIADQAKLLKQVKSLADWVDPKTGLGKGRAAFQKRRYKINDLTNKLADATAKVKDVIDKGSTLDVKVERAGAFSGEVAALSTGTPPFEWTVNGKKVAKGATIAIGNDRVIKLQVKLVDDRRKQSRTIKDGRFAKKKVAQEDYDFEYGIDDASYSHWVIDEEEYTDWRLEARTPREPTHPVSASGVHAKVKGDVMTITFSPDTASEKLHISVIGRTRWAMSGRRAGGPTVDSADGSGNASIDISIAPSK